MSIILIDGCSTNSVTAPTKTSFKGTFNTAGLEGITVNNFNPFKGSIYAATNKGLYKKGQGNASWTSLGLQQEKVLNVVFLPDNKLLAAIHIPDFSGGITSLFLSVDNGQSWQSFMGNYGGETRKYTWVASLASNAQPSDTIFARVSGLTVTRSMDGGNSWKAVNGNWNGYGGAAVLVKADPYYKKRIWAGGVNAFSFPYLLKSTDGGETWKNLKKIQTTTQICYDVVSHPKNKAWVLAGLAGAISQALQIRKSTDGGKTWTTVLEGMGVLTLANSLRSSEAVYASGRNTDGSIFFAASRDFGDTWQTITMPDSPAGIQVNDMVSVMQDGHEVLYLGTNKGVYSYRFEQ